MFRRTTFHRAPLAALTLLLALTGPALAQVS